MIELDPCVLAPEIATILLRRGAELPPLEWHNRPDKTARKTLDQFEDAKLFARNGLADEEMATAVRSLLYLWSGWPDDCKMCAQGAPDAEAHYLEGLCERQVGNVDAAKKAFQQAGGHDVCPELVTFTRKHVRAVVDPMIKRLADMLALTEEWEPFAFIDLCQQGREEKLSLAAGQAVCAIQCREFELLLAHCYRKATGEEIRARPKIEAQKRTPKPMPRKRPTRRVQDPVEQPDTAASPGPVEAKVEPVPTVGVRCPKCSGVLLVPEDQRGRAVKCGRCGTFFRIPSRQSSHEIRAHAK